MPARIHRLLLLGALAMAATATPAQTKMFKCIVAGRTVYQQTECAAAAPEEEAKPATRAASAPRRAASAASGAVTATAKARGTRDPTGH